MDNSLRAARRAFRRRAAKARLLAIKTKQL